MLLLSVMGVHRVSKENASANKPKSAATIERALTLRTCRSRNKRFGLSVSYS
jgi:hypothetical protein